MRAEGARPSGVAQTGLYAAVAFLGISRLWVEGYSFGTADQSWQAPMVRGLAGHEFLKDYIFKTPLKLSFFFPITAFFTRHFAIEQVYLVGYVVASVAAMIATYLLASKVLRSRPAALLAALLLMVGKNVAAGARTWDALLLPRTAALPLMLLSWWLFLEERELTAGLLAGLAFALHPLTGIYAVAIAAAGIAAGRARRGPRALRFAGGMIVPAALTLWYLLPSPAALLHAPEEWYMVMLARNIHHVAPASPLVFAAVLAYALWCGYQVKGAGGNASLLFAATGVAAVIFMYAGVAEIAGRIAHLSEPRMTLLYPPALATLQPLRIAGPLGILVLVATAGILWRAMQKGFVARVAAVGAVVALGFGHHAAGASVVAAAGHYAAGGLFVAAAVLSQHASRALRAAAVAAAITAIGWTLAQEKTLLVLLMGAIALSILVTRATHTRLEAAAATLVTLGALLGMTSPRWAAIVAQRAFPGRALADSAAYRPRFSMSLQPDQPVAEAAAWVRANTAPDDVIVVPPGWESFRVAADRPVCGTYKDGTLTFFNSALAGEWLARMNALGVPLSEDGGSRLTLEDVESSGAYAAARMAAAARVSHARYVVRFAEDLPGFDLAFAGRYVTIYRVPR